MPSLDTAQLIALAGALGWASGIRLYLVVLLTGLAGLMGWVNLPRGLQVLANPVVLAVVLAVVLVLGIWLIRVRWRFLTPLFTRVARVFSGKPDPGLSPAFSLKSPFSKE
ncbi:MAG: DUF4126 domain-containing protein [Polaromonas sp.]